jgi:branched-chain amino acid aminotransferase
MHDRRVPSPEVLMPSSISTHAPISETWTFYEGDWHPGNVGIMGPRTHAAWLGTMLFDGGRSFEGVTPDLDLHCARINQSAERFHLTPAVSTERWMELAQDGIKKFAPGTPLYIRPMYWADTGMIGGGIKFDPDSTRWCLCLYEAPMPEPRGVSVTLSSQRRPTIECAPVDAKAGCLYPNNARAIWEAGTRGFDNCLLRDFVGNIAELANANVFMAKDGVVFTPAANGTFLAGITRRRVISLLRADGVEVVESMLTWPDFLGADEIFSAGNFSKVVPVIRIEQRELQPGPLFRKARELYWAFAHGG